MNKPQKSLSKARPRKSQGLCKLCSKVCLQQFRVPTGKDGKKCSPNDSFQRIFRVSFLCCALSQPPLYTSAFPSGKWHTSLDAWFVQRISCNDDVYEGTCQLRIILLYCSLHCAIYTKHMSLGFESRQEA